MTETEALHAAQERANARALSLLPEEVRRVAEVIGIASAVRLVKEWPKSSGRSRDSRVELYVPTVERMRADHPLAASIGWDAAEQLCKAMSGSTLKLGNCGDIERRALHGQIISLAAKGLPVAYVAKMVGRTPQTVRNVIAKSGQGASDDGNG